MKFFFSIIIFSLLSQTISGQIVNGRIIDASNGNPLEYASIGAIGTPLGCITDKEGKFELDLSSLSKEATINVSMISYRSQSFSLQEFITLGKTIALVPSPTQLSDIIIRPAGRTFKIGVFTFDRKALYGWTGAEPGKGREKGTQFYLGKKPVRLLSLHMNLAVNSFDTCFFRMHIRKLEHDFPTDELLTENIVIPINVQTGWYEFDLDKYNLVFKDKIALTLELLKNGKLIEKSLSEDGKKIIPRIYFNLNMKRRGEGLFVKDGVEGNWQWAKRNPTMYITVQELNNK